MFMKIVGHVLMYDLSIKYLIHVLTKAILDEWHHEKTNNLHNVKTKRQISCAVTAKLITPLFSLHG